MATGLLSSGLDEEIEMGAMELFILFLLTGLFLLGAEIFVPGGILGVMGAVALIGAMLVGFQVFGPQQGALVAFLILVFMGVSLVVWIQVLPRTRVGKSLTLSDSLEGYSSTRQSLKDYVGKEGEAVSVLGPSGLIRIDGKRLDAVAEGKWIDAGARIRVVHVTGNHLTVREVAAPPEGSAEDSVAA